jgi:hypothetical protein
MNQRRDFFKQFIGQVGVYRDEIRGVESIPLNRLKELPEDIIEEIEPVFFPEELWHLKDRVLYIPESKSAKSINIELNDIEFKAIGYFQKGMKLKPTALKIGVETEFPFEDVYHAVTSLFFKLATLRICHPKTVYNIDEIIKQRKQ